MDFLRKQLSKSPEIARVAPFAIFVFLTALQGKAGEDSRYWIYMLKTVIGVWLIWEMWPWVGEMRWKLSWEAVVAGVLVFAIWVGLDGLYPRLAKVEASWNPLQRYGQSSALAWVYIAGRIAGSSLVVPPLEEVFYRSFLYRYLVNIKSATADFRELPLGRFYPISFVSTSLIFGLMHPDRWLAGCLCGFAYQGLVVRKNRIGDAMTAHGITNCLLGLWVVGKGDWTFW
jgi:CAAX prenyl protease-like protein